MNKTAVSIPAELIPEFEAWGKYTSRLLANCAVKQVCLR